MHHPTRSITKWHWAGFLLCAIVAMPLLALVGEAISTQNISAWPDLLRYSLPTATLNTFILLIVSMGVGLIFGAGSAIALHLCEVPLRTLLAFCCVIPLAMPSYIGSLGLIMWLDQNSAILGMQTLRALLTSPVGGGLVFGLSLSPYVFLICYGFLRTVDLSCISAAYTMGISNRTIILQVVLPLLRPACVGACALIGMEVLNDVGTVSFLGITTLTTRAYSAWVNQGQLSTAAQIAVLVLILALVLLAAERRARKALSLHSDGNIHRNPARLRLHTWGHFAFIVPCLIPFLLMFVLPLCVFIHNAFTRRHMVDTQAVFSAFGNSFLMGLGVAIICCLCAVVLVTAIRMTGHRFLRGILRMANSGYAIPGTLVGLGLLLCLPVVSTIWDSAFPAHQGAVVRLLLINAPILVLIALCIRFMAVASAPIESAMQTLSPALESAARTLGATQAGAIRSIRLPLLMPVVLSSGLMVSIDTIKELPATLLLRPLGFETLPTLIYAAAHREAYEEAAPAALLLVLCCLPILLSVMRLVGRR